MSKKKLLSTAEFANAYNYTVAEVVTLIRGGELPADAVGGRYVIDIDRVEAEAPDVLDGPDDDDIDDEVDDDENAGDDDEDADEEDEDDDEEE